MDITDMVEALDDNIVYWCWTTRAGCVAHTDGGRGMEQTYNINFFSLLLFLSVSVSVSLPIALRLASLDKEKKRTAKVKRRNAQRRAAARQTGISVYTVFRGRCCCLRSQYPYPLPLATMPCGGAAAESALPAPLGSDTFMATGATVPAVGLWLGRLLDGLCAGCRELWG